jgi:CRP-like cAMP-binding protein
MSTKISCITCPNSNCFIQLYCSSEWLELLDRRKYQTLFKKNQNIINEGTPVLGIYFIQNGKVKVLSTGHTGRLQIVRFAVEGHVLGHRGFGNDVYPISAVAMEDSLICFVENELLYKMFMAIPKFTHGLMMFYSRELRKVENRMKNIAQMNTREKIAEALLLVQENFGLNSQNELNVSLTREDIANTAGTTSEQVVRQLTDFENEGIIAKHVRKIVILNLEGLKKIISEHNSHHIIE